jgi:hypothetical protein
MDPKTPAAEAPAPADYDVMSSVFDGLLAPTPATETAPASTSEVDEAAAAAGAVTTPPAETPPAETPPVAAPAAEAPPAEPPPTAEPPSAAVETPPEEIDWKARFDALQAEKAAAPPPAAPAAEAPPAETPPVEVYSADEKEFLAQYAENWPDITRGEALRRRAEYGQLVTHIFSEFNRIYAPLIERGAAAADTVAENAALTVIQGAHSDYDDKMYDDVISWADGLTGTRKKFAQAVIEGGDPNEVVELITEFKTATGRKPRVVADGGVTPPAAPAAPTSVTQLSAAAKKAAKALGVVDSKRSVNATSAADPNDFDAAWDEAVGTK